LDVALVDAHHATVGGELNCPAVGVGVPALYRAASAVELRPVDEAVETYLCVLLHAGGAGGCGRIAMAAPAFLLRVSKELARQGLQVAFFDRTKKTQVYSVRSARLRGSCCCLS